MDQLHLITINESAESRIEATGAELTVCISGQSFFTGSEAFKKAAEVSQCVTSVKDCGVKEGEISILNVAAEVETGILGKSSLAKYYISIRCQSIDILGPIVSAIASQKNAKLEEILWTYGSLETIQEKLLQSAVRKAKVTAEGIADELGTRCSAVHQLSYDFKGIDRHGYNARPSPYDGVKRKRLSPNTPLHEINFQHQVKLEVNLSAQFAVAPFQHAN